MLCVRWYLRFGLSFRNLEEIMAERNLTVDHVTIWRWVQRYTPELHRRCRQELRKTNRSWRVDETYLRVAGKWTYLYRAVDSTGATIDFLLSARRDAAAAKRFFQKALRSVGHPRPRVINVDGNPSYPRVIGELKRARRTWTALPMPPCALPEQHRGAGPPSDQTASESQSRVSLLRCCSANHSGYRDGEHDPQGTSQMVGEGRHRWAGGVRSRALRSHRCCLMARANHFSRS